MSRDNQIPCPIRGCKRKRDPMHVMCRTHWYQVTRSLRERIWRLFKTERGSDSHRMAVQAAIEEVEQQEGMENGQ